VLGIVPNKFGKNSLIEVKAKEEDERMKEETARKGLI